ncbi:MAG: hypothetical protein ACLQAT_01855 [Candidatus Binataceae bacterium]
MKIVRVLACLTIAAFCTTGCSAPLPSTELPPGRMVAPALEFPELRDYRGVLDLRVKDANLDQEAVAELAKTAQIDFIALGDRAKPGDTDYGIGGFTSDILFIPGASFAADGGEIIAINPHAPIDPTKSPNEIIGAIHDEGGVAIAAAPTKFGSPDDYALADAIEVYNQREEWMADSQSAIYWRAVFLTTDRFMLDLLPRPDANLAVYDRMTSGARIALVAGIGAPDNLAVAGSKVGTLEQLLLFYTTHLLAPERNVDAVVDALKRGHAYVSFDILGYVGEFAFFAHDGDTKTMMGDEAHLTPGLKLAAELPAAADKIVLFRNGAQVSSADNTEDLEFAATEPGTYRVEAYRKGHLWILSNPVYVR